MDAGDSFGNWLRRRRRAQDLTQEQLAACARCSVITIRKFESDERHPSRQLAELLADCLGIPPQEKETFIAFARSRGGFEAPDRVEHPGAGVPPPGAVPAGLTPLLGRDSELDALLDALLERRVRLLTLTGPGGSGKTRLALETARLVAARSAQAFPDGAFFVDLVAVTQPAALLPAVVQSLGIKETAAQTPEEALTAWLRSRKLLLVLDNFEQILEAAPGLLPLLAVAPDLSILVTSRAPLRLYGEQAFPVHPLSFPDPDDLPTEFDPGDYPAVQLFLDRARAVNPRIAPSAENLAAIVAICARLDGLPLAIELAASRSRQYTPGALLVRLTHSLDVLTGAYRGVSERQNTLRGAIDWSYNLLDRDRQRLFTLLGIFFGEFDAAAAAAVYHTGLSAPDQASEAAGQVFDGLFGLADQSMVQIVDGGESGPPHRFRLLQTLREYALDKLALEGGLEPARDQHARHYLGVAEASAEQYRSESISGALSRMDAALDNLRAALQWCLEDPERVSLAARMALALAEYWKIRGYLNEGRAAFNAILERLEGAPVERTAVLLDAAGDLAEAQGDYVQAEELLTRSMEIWHRIEEPEGIARNLLLVGRMNWRWERYDIAQTQTAEDLALARELENLNDVTLALNVLGNIAHYRSELTESRRYLEESLAFARKTGNVPMIGTGLGNLGSITQIEGDYSRARALFEESLSIFRKLGFKERAASVLGNLGNTGLKIDDLDLAQTCYEECLRLRRELGLRGASGQPLHGLGIVANRRGHAAAAMAFLAESLEVQYESGSVRSLPVLVETIGNIVLESGRTAEAVMLYGAMEALMERQITAARSPHSRSGYDEHMAEMRLRLPADEFTAAWNAGRGLSLEAAVQLAAGLSEKGPETTAWPEREPAARTRYVQEELLASGGMGAVYRGRDTTSGQAVAIKKLRLDKAVQSPELVERFRREGDLLRKLDHPNIVKMLAALEENGHYLIVMEYVPGGTLRKLMEETAAVPVQRVLAIALELADALARAHHLGILHRDIKPENVLLAEDGTPRLTDFGIANRLQREMRTESRLTGSGIVLGTTAYLSPEACMGEELDVRSDIWSFGVLLFEMLTGAIPFAGANLLALLTAILTQPAPSVWSVRPESPGGVNSLLERMLAKDRSARPAGMRAVAAELEAALVGV